MHHELKNIEKTNALLGSKGVSFSDYCSELSRGQPIWEKTWRQSSLLLFYLGNKLFQNIVEQSKHAHDIFLCVFALRIRRPHLASQGRRPCSTDTFAVTIQDHFGWFVLLFLEYGDSWVISWVVWHLTTNRACFKKQEMKAASMLGCRNSQCHLFHVLYLSKELQSPLRFLMGGLEISLLDGINVKEFVAIFNMLSYLVHGDYSRWLSWSLNSTVRFFFPLLLLLKLLR